jgi:drug/metabolite transporter (DMT)-like permease
MVQDAIETTPVFAFLFFRFLLASVLMFFISYKLLNQINKQTILYGTILGILLFSSFALQTFGLVYAPSSVVAFITGLFVIVTPFLLLLFFKEKIPRNVLLASLFAVIGLYLLTMSGNLTLGFGEFLTLLCALGFALHLIYTGIYSKKVNVFLLVFIQLSTVTFLSLLFSLLFEDKTFNLPYDYNFFKATLVTAVFATIYAFIIQTYMQQFTSPTKAAIIFTMEPVSAGFFGYFVAEEILTSIQLIGAVVIICAMLLAEIKFKKDSS